MATRRDLTKAYAREYERASKKRKGEMVDGVVRGDRLVEGERPPPAPEVAATLMGRAGQAPRKPRARKYSYDASKVLEEAWTLAGEPFWQVPRRGPGRTTSPPPRTPG